MSEPIRILHVLAAMSMAGTETLLVDIESTAIGTIDFKQV